MDNNYYVILRKVLTLCKQNKEFEEELKKRLEIEQHSTFPQSIDHNSIQKIEKYLGLDYSLDSKEPIIDYSAIKDDHVREQLIADYREMLRWRYGTRSHKIDFMEFCRYAHLQAEMLFNYYYTVRFNGNMDQINNYFTKYNSYKKPDDNASKKSNKKPNKKSNKKPNEESNKIVKPKNYTSLHAASYIDKLWSFNNETKVSGEEGEKTKGRLYSNKTINILTKVQIIRNLTSHRSKDNNQKKDLDEYQKIYKEEGFKFDYLGDIYLNKKNESDSEKNKRLTKIKVSYEYK